MKLYALSDIHGRTFSLDQFINLGFDVADPSHHIIFLGDYFDRYDDNHGVFLELIKIKALLNERCHFIIGNHDGYMKEFIDFTLSHNTIGKPLIVDADLMERWNRNGAETTLKQCFFMDDLSSLYNKEMETRLLMYQSFIGLLQGYIEIGDMIFTHAGLSREYEFDFWTREPIHHDNPFPNKTLVIGHSPFHYCAKFSHLMRVPTPTHIGQMVINKEKDNKIYIIDNGEGNNIVCFDVKPKRVSHQNLNEV